MYVSRASDSCASNERLNVMLQTPALIAASLSCALPFLENEGEGPETKVMAPK